MSTSVDHPQVRNYLSRLDAALALLPPQRATTLRAQIVAHLEDSLEVGSDDARVAGTLASLGDPADIVAAALEDAPMERPTGWRTALTRIVVPVLAALIAIAACAVLVAALVGALVPPATIALSVVGLLLGVAVLIRAVRKVRAR